MEKLLILQEKDRVRVNLEAELESLPREITANREKIAREEARVKEARDTTRNLEARRNALEGELEELNAKIVRYKNQQLEVKKNDEYQALEHEIETVKAKISELEDEELQVMVDIDESRATADELERSHRENIAALEERIRKLEEREVRCREELEEAVRRSEEARGAVPSGLLTAYDNLMQHVKLPVAVALRDKKCQGCHLKVSAGVESDARQGKEIAACDSCGRLLYCE